MELKNFERVTITGDDDDLVIPIENQADDTPNLSLCLVGRFLTDRTIRIPIVRPKKGVSIKEVDKGIFLFQFFHPINVKNVLKGGPWSFDKHFLLLSVIRGRENPSHNYYSRHHFVFKYVTYLRALC
ncbi:hypothetical protein GmHk_18G052294 [Glycine max]|nr:hypothetical protein GmHk_18G052294 [Glycine max]